MTRLICAEAIRLLWKVVRVDALHFILTSTALCTIPDPGIVQIKVAVGITNGSSQ